MTLDTFREWLPAIMTFVALIGAWFKLKNVVDVHGEKLDGHGQTIEGYGKTIQSHHGKLETHAARLEEHDKLHTSHAIKLVKVDQIEDLNRRELAHLEDLTKTQQALALSHSETRGDVKVLLERTSRRGE